MKRFWTLLAAVLFGFAYAVVVAILVPNMPTWVVGTLAGVTATLTVFVLTVNS